jgi:hypothetical protein
MAYIAGFLARKLVFWRGPWRVEQQWLAQQINEHLEANLGAGRNKYSEVDEESTGVTVSVAQSDG